MVLTKTGFKTDQQADLKVHGGLEKAVHHYAADHYSAWRQEVDDEPDIFKPGGFGENISTIGMTENTLCIGDVFRMGTALVQISQGRQPCWKLNAPYRVQSNGNAVPENGTDGMVLSGP